MLSDVHASSIRLRSERSSDMAVACDITANSVVAELFDMALCRSYSRTALYGVKISADNAYETLKRFIPTALRSADVPAKAVKSAVFSADVHVSDDLEQTITADELSLHSETQICFVPYISARLSGRFTATLLTVPRENFLAADVGASLCIAESKNGALRCAGFPLSGAFDGTALESGMPSENGAIDAVRRERDGTIAYEVVGDADSLGISPSGALCAARIMLSENIIDADGIMTDRDLFAIGEDFFVSQSDIRAIQSDKAKCSAAFEMFNGEKTYLSGAPFANDEGFKAMAAIGALPKGEIGFCGNSALRGAENYLLSEKYRETARDIVKNAEDISEQVLDKFEEKYFEHLCFVKKY